MSNYNEAWESEKRTLSLLVETSFYPSANSSDEPQTQTDEKARIIDALLSNPALAQQVVQLLQSSAATTQVMQSV